MGFMSREDRRKKEAEDKRIKADQAARRKLEEEEAKKREEELKRTRQKEAEEVAERKRLAAVAEHFGNAGEQLKRLKRSCASWLKKDLRNAMENLLRNWFNHIQVDASFLEDRDEAGRTMLHDRCQQGHIMVVQHLVSLLPPGSLDDMQCAADGLPVLCVANDGTRPHHEAALGGHLHVLVYLVEKVGADVRSRLHDGSTALHLACHEGLLDIVKFLLAVHPNKDEEGPGGWTPLHLACKGGGSGALEVMSHLLSMASSPFQCPVAEGGWTPLHVAAKYGHAKLVAYLLQGDYCQAGQALDGGEQALHLAAWGGDMATVQALVKAGANPHHTDSVGASCLHMAAAHGHVEVVQYLVETVGLDPDSTTMDKETPLKLACKKQQTGVVRYFSLYSLNSKRAEPVGQSRTTRDVQAALLAAPSGPASPAPRQPRRVGCGACQAAPRCPACFQCYQIVHRDASPTRYLDEAAKLNGKVKADPGTSPPSRDPWAMARDTLAPERLQKYIKPPGSRSRSRNR